MQSTLDRRVIYLMLRGARRQATDRRGKPAAGTLRARLTRAGWWLDAREAAPRATAAPQLAVSNTSERLPATVAADE